MKKTHADLGRYILVTPVKNEERNLPSFIQSVITQTIKPELWVIVDDGSTDSSPEIIDEVKDKYEWVQALHLDDYGRERGIHLALVMKKGFEFALDYCKKKGLRYDYIANVDADGVYEDSYFEKLLKKFEDDPRLGIAGGADWLIEEDQIKLMERRLPSFGGIVIKKKCFEDLGGIPISYSFDSVLNAKAMLKGWEIKRFDDSKAFRVRGLAYGEGLWNGYKKLGESYYFINYNFFYSIAKGLESVFKKPFYIGLAFLWGYLSSLALRKEKINDKEVRYYFWHIRPREVNRYYFDKLRNKVKRK